MKLDFSVTTLVSSQPQSTDINWELINLFKNRQQAAQLSHVQLAKFLGYKNTNKTLRRLRQFEKTGELADSYLQKLSEILNIDLTEVKQIQAHYLQQRYSEMNLFIKYFDHIWPHRTFIVRHPDYANISFPGIYLSVAYLGTPSYNIGMLLQHYMKGNWMVDTICCDRLYIIGAGGSPLSGTNTCHGFCHSCGGQKSFKFASFVALIKAHKELLPACQQNKTSKTMIDLLNDFQL